MREPRRAPPVSHPERRSEGAGHGWQADGGCGRGRAGGGAALSALLLAGERRSGKPSELAQLERESARRIGRDTPPADAVPAAGEQALVQGGHLLLSALAGAAYAAATDEDAAVLPSGIVFGLSFYALMHWITGPALGVKPPEWRSEPGTIGMHGVNHLLFGLAVAGGAKLARRR